MDKPLLHAYRLVSRELDVWLCDSQYGERYAVEQTVPFLILGTAGGPCFPSWPAAYARYPTTACLYSFFCLPQLYGRWRVGLHLPTADNKPFPSANPSTMLASFTTFMP